MTTQFSEDIHTIRCASRVLPPVLAFVVILAACSGGSANIPTAAAPTLPPTWTPTPTAPTATPLPTATQTPSPTATPACDLAATLREAKAAVPYEQYAVLINQVAGTRSLVVWFVDPDLVPYPTPETLPQQFSLAVSHATRVAAAITQASPCVSRLVDVVNPVVVDSRYQGWFSGLVRPADLPTVPDPTEEQIAAASAEFLVGYQRSALRHDFQNGTCRWPEARERLQSHFSQERENVAFYFVIDDGGSHVWIQWDGPADPIMMSVNLGNIFLALECFSQESDIIFTIVDDQAVVMAAGIVPINNPGQLRVAYP